MTVVSQATTSHVRRRYGFATTWIVAGAISLFPCLAWAWRRSLDTVFFAISGDDFHRTLHSWEVTHGRLLPSDLWPPLQFWIQALVLQIYPHLLSVPSLVNLTAATGTLIGLVLLSRVLGLSSAAALLQLLLVATLPWFVWLSLSGLAEPLFFLTIVMAYFGVAHWYKWQQNWALWFAAVSLLAAGMLRFDAWGHSLVFTLAIAWSWWRSTTQRQHQSLLAAALPWIFPVFWLAYQANQYGDPFYFSFVTREYYLRTNAPLPLLTRLLWQPRDLLAVGGIVVVLGLSGVWWLRRCPGLPVLGLMWLASLALLIQSTLNHTISQNNPVRLVLIHVLLLTPAAALVLERIARRGLMPALAVAAVLVIIVVPRIQSIPRYPNALAGDVQQVGQYIASLRNQNQLQVDDQIMVEVLFWDYLLLQVVSNDPGAVVFDRPPLLVITPDGRRTLDDITNPSVLATHGDQLAVELEQRDVRLVVAHSERAWNNLDRIASEVLHAGRFKVYTVR